MSTARKNCALSLNSSQNSELIIVYSSLRGLMKGGRWSSGNLRMSKGALQSLFFFLPKGGFRRFALRHERLLFTFKGFFYFACFLIAWRVLR